MPSAPSLDVFPFSFLSFLLSLALSLLSFLQGCGMGRGREN